MLLDQRNNFWSLQLTANVLVNLATKLPLQSVLQENIDRLSVGIIQMGTNRLWEIVLLEYTPDLTNHMLGTLILQVQVGNNVLPELIPHRATEFDHLPYPTLRSSSESYNIILSVNLCNLHNYRWLKSEEEGGPETMLHVALSNQWCWCVVVLLHFPVEVEIVRVQATHSLCSNSLANTDGGEASFAQLLQQESYAFHLLLDCLQSDTSKTHLVFHIVSHLLENLDGGQVGFQSDCFTHNQLAQHLSEVDNQCTVLLDSVLQDCDKSEALGGLKVFNMHKMFRRVVVMWLCIYKVRDILAFGNVLDNLNFHTLLWWALALVTLVAFIATRASQSMESEKGLLHTQAFELSGFGAFYLRARVADTLVTSFASFTLVLEV